jgi:hypothetical protein
LRLNDLRHRIGPAPNRSAGPERGYLREGENMETAGHPPNLTRNTFGQHGHICAFFNSIDMRTHPLVIIGGLLQQNPFFVPPDQLLLEIRDRESSTA